MGRANGTQMISNPWGDDRPPTWILREGGEIHKDNQWFQIPGGDAIFGHVAARAAQPLAALHASDGHQQGAERILHENLGNYGWGVTPQLARYVNGAMGVRGVNFTVLHAYWSNPDSVRYPPPLQPSNPWWAAMDGIVDWTGRVMELTRGAAAAPTALLHPQSAAEAWQRTADGRRRSTPASDAMAFAMEDAQVDFDMLDEASLERRPGDAAPGGGARRRSLRIGSQAYRVVVMPPAPTMSLEAVRRLERLVGERRDGDLLRAAADTRRTGHDDELRGCTRAPLRRAAGARRVATVAGSSRRCDEAEAPAAQLAPASPEVRVLRLSTATTRVPADERGHRAGGHHRRVPESPARRRCGIPTTARTASRLDSAPTVSSGAPRCRCTWSRRRCWPSSSAAAGRQAAVPHLVQSTFRSSP